MASLLSSIHSKNETFAILSLMIIIFAQCKKILTRFLFEVLVINFQVNPVVHSENTFQSDQLVFPAVVDKKIDDEVLIRRVQRFHDGKRINLLFFIK